MCISIQYLHQQSVIVAELARLKMRQELEMCLEDGGTGELAYFLQDQSGNSFFEHALLLSLMAVVFLLALLAICKGS